MKTWSVHEEFFPSLDSTNEWCKHYAFPKDETSMIIVRADAQTHGRGQHGRIWVSPAGCNIYQSYCFLLPHHDPIAHLAQILSLSLLHTLQGYDVNPRIKWPNDIVVEGKKISGVLCEIYDHRAVAGIGININMPQEWLDKVPQPATSLKTLLGCDISIDAFLVALNRRFLDDLSILFAQGFAPFYTDYLENLLYLNQIVKWTLGTETQIGRLKGIDSKGRIILFLENTETEMVIQSGQIHPYETYS